ncbi:hypothetical protein LCGC14_1088920 [marine sediment metagenome]|uniref:Uncharacterized protein n=1 Tax=marine sediment metagenome TaxID=412755 RepID=A0A0F9QJ23_9ZZZZ
MNHWLPEVSRVGCDVDGRQKGHGFILEVPWFGLGGFPRGLWRGWAMLRLALLLGR